MENIICSDCGEAISQEQARTTNDGRTICENCADEGYFWCEDCETYVPSEDIREVTFRHPTVFGRYETRYICIDCLEHSSSYWQCEDCHSWFNERVDSIFVRNHGSICESCYVDGSYVTCHECGDVVSYGESEWDDAYEEYVCRNCARERVHEDDHHNLHQYSYKPDPKPHTRRKCKCDSCNDVADLLFGCELEVDKGPSNERSAAIREIADASQDVYMKSDGSLVSGFEIVTHPCTLEYHMYEFRWRKITSIAKHHGFKSHDARTCGLHVHVGRYQLGTDDTARHQTIGNLIMLVDRHWDALVKFSRRQEDQLRWAVRPQIIKATDGDTEDQVLEKAFAANNGNRYQAINLNNYGTIEFRLFNGTLKRDTIIATLQLISNMCLYAKTHSPTECLASKWSDLTTYHIHDELTEYCKTIGLVNVQDPSPIDLVAPAQQEPTGEVNADIHVGSIVRAVQGPRQGLTGIVLDIIPDIAFGYAVSFPGWHDGHNCARADISDSGWWFNREDLIPA